MLATTPPDSGLPDGGSKNAMMRVRGGSPTPLANRQSPIATMTLSDFLLFALPAIFLTGLSKGGFGGALGGIAVPLLALAISPKQAAAVMLPILCLADVSV